MRKLELQLASITIPCGYGFRIALRLSGTTASTLRAPTARSHRRRTSLLPLRRNLDPPRQHFPIRPRAKPLQQVHEPRIAADQDTRRVLLDAGDDDLRG